MQADNLCRLPLEVRVVGGHAPVQSVRSQTVLATPARLSCGESPASTLDGGYSSGCCRREALGGSPGESGPPSSASPGGDSAPCAGCTSPPASRSETAGASGPRSRESRPAAHTHRSNSGLPPAAGITRARRASSALIVRDRCSSVLCSDSDRTIAFSMNRSISVQKHPLQATRGLVAELVNRSSVPAWLLAGRASGWAAVFLAVNKLVHVDGCG